MKTVVKRDFLTDVDFQSLADRVESILEVRLRAGDRIVSVNFLPNFSPNAALIFYSYEQPEEQNRYGW